jgi:hypothetical protein
MAGSTITAATEPETPGIAALARPRSTWLKFAVVAVIAALLAGAGVQIREMNASHSDNPNRAFPVSAAMQDKLGVRFSRVAVVADGGLITLFYVVLDPEKAAAFQANQAHPPKLTSESRNLSTNRVSLMKQGHVLNAGKTYYLVYENTRRALRPGEQATIGYGSLRLEHVPVL